MKNTTLLDTTGIVFMGVYLVSLLLIGVAGRLARKENSLDRKSTRLNSSH